MVIMTAAITAHPRLLRKPAELLFERFTIPLPPASSKHGAGVLQCVII
jgi:hypothetical protein